MQWKKNQGSYTALDLWMGNKQSGLDWATQHYSSARRHSCSCAGQGEEGGLRAELHTLLRKRNGWETAKEEKIWRTKIEKEVLRSGKGVLTMERPAKVDEAEVGFLFTFLGSTPKSCSSFFLSPECNCCSIQGGIGKFELEVEPECNCCHVRWSRSWVARKGMRMLPCFSLTGGQH